MLEATQWKNHGRSGREGKPEKGWTWTGKITIDEKLQLEKVNLERLKIEADPNLQKEKLESVVRLREAETKKRDTNPEIDKFRHEVEELTAQNHSTVSKRTSIRLPLTSLVFFFIMSWSRRIYSPYSYVFRRRLQDVLIKTNIFVLVICLQDVFKTFSRRLQDVFNTSSKNVFKTSSRHLQDVFKTSSRRLQDILKTSCYDVFKTSSKSLQDVLQKRLQGIFKTSSKSFEDAFKTSCKDVFKTCSRRMMELICSC